MPRTHKAPGPAASPTSHRPLLSASRGYDSLSLYSPGTVLPKACSLGAPLSDVVSYKTARTLSQWRTQLTDTFARSTLAPCGYPQGAQLGVGIALAYLSLLRSRLSCCHTPKVSVWSTRWGKPLLSLASAVPTRRLVGTSHQTCPPIVPR